MINCNEDNYEEHTIQMVIVLETKKGDLYRNKTEVNLFFKSFFILKTNQIKFLSEKITSDFRPILWLFPSGESSLEFFYLLVFLGTSLVITGFHPLKEENPKNTFSKLVIKIGEE